MRSHQRDGDLSPNVVQSEPTSPGSPISIEKREKLTPSKFREKLKQHIRSRSNSFASSLRDLPPIATSVPEPTEIPEPVPKHLVILDTALQHMLIRGLIRCSGVEHLVKHAKLVLQWLCTRATWELNTEIQLASESALALLGMDTQAWHTLGRPETTRTFSSATHEPFVSR